MQPTFLHLAAGAAAADPVSTRDLSSWPSLCRNGSQQSASRRLTSCGCQLVPLCFSHHFDGIAWLGTSGVVLTLWEWSRERASIDHSLAALSLLFGCVVFISYWLMQKIPFNPFLLLSDHGQFLFMPLYYAVVAAPFFCSGLTIGLLLFRGRQKADRLYAADLIGAGVGMLRLH